MGNQASVPTPGTKLQVIGAGLPRTGTASFSEALRILLDAPVYHGGTQCTMGQPIEMLSWIKVLRLFPFRVDADRKAALSLIRQRLDGYAAVTDSPGNGLIPELLDLYPDAKVICTVRDPEAWEKSMVGVASASTKWFLRGVLLPLPTMRHFVDYINALRDQWLYLYGETEPPTTISYNRHMELLRETVPADRLVFLEVKDGWEPLCKALGKDIPDVPFPRINDSEAIDKFAAKTAMRGLIRWSILLAAVGAGIAVYSTQ
ncbi:NAD dependent epimerase/dehydratase [Diaporthe sp. PMI_573]|nr:NAD dependent epimerase/dehydratase [Diaporthaceae sp. PMI_573]